MISTIDIEINAANPSLPLTPFKAYVNSPSSIRVRNVPRKVGKWEVTKVFISANYPDNSIKTAECVLTGGVWVGTVPGCASVGRSVNGYQITANGTDENGAPVTGYCLGVGDVEIKSRDATITIGETTYYVHILDAQPQTPHKGDLCKITGVWKLYNGTQWETLGGGGGGGSVNDVKVNGISVVDANGVALIDISGKADATALTAEINRATAAEALKADQTALTAEVNRATAAEATKASAASLTAETNRATAAEALKRDKTDMTIPAGYDVTIPAGSQKTDKSKYAYEWYDEYEPTGYIVYYDGGRLGFGEANNQHDDFTVEDEGLTYSFTWVAADTIAKTSEVNAGLAAKVQKPTNESGADGKFLKKTEDGTEWAGETDPTVPSWAKAATKPTYTAAEVGALPTTGGTITGDVYVKKLSANVRIGVYGDDTGWVPEGQTPADCVLTIGSHCRDDEGASVPATGVVNIGIDAEYPEQGSAGVLNVGGAPDGYAYGGDGEINVRKQSNGTKLTITHTGSANETLTQRIVRDANVAGQITADKTHAVSISATGVNPISPNASTGNVDVSTLFSGANTSNNLDNIRVSANDSTTASTLIGGKITNPTTTATTDKFLKRDGSGNVSWADGGGGSSAYGTNPLEFNEDDIATVTDGSLNIASTTPEACVVKIPVPASNKITECIVQFDTSSDVPQVTWKPLNGSSTGATTQIDWRNVSGDTMASGTGKKYWIMIQLWSNPLGSAKPYTGVMTTRELTA